MNKVRSAIFAMVALVSLTTASFAQTYPTTNPTYVPTAQLTAQSITATGDYELFTNQGNAGASIQVDGSPVGLVGSVQCSTNGTTFASVGLEKVGGAANGTSITGVGIWRFSMAGFTKCKFNVTGYTSGATTVKIAATPAANRVNFFTNGQDPCQDPNVAKSSVAITISSATTTNLVSAVSAQKVYVCGFVVTYTSGTSPTIAFIYGTTASTACDTGATTLYPASAIPATAGQGLNVFPGHTLTSGATAKQLCVVSGGTTPTYNGILTFVQQQ